MLTESLRGAVSFLKASLWIVNSHRRLPRFRSSTKSVFNTLDCTLYFGAS
jgi:hypothetical protein